MTQTASAEGSGQSLNRSMGLSGLVFYGSGTILGAGIFVVIGEVIGEAGTLSPLAYLLAGLVAITTALSFSEIGARIPTAAGPIDYVEKAFNSRKFGSLAGWMLVIANIVSGATITTGFASYLSSIVEVPDWVAITGLIAVLSIISIAGMKESATFMTITTAVGILALLFVLFVTRDSLAAAPSKMIGELSSFDGAAMSGLFAGAFLAVYSFIGFGDMAQTAEEVKNVKRNLPRAIIIAMIIVFAFYLAISAALIGHEDIEALTEARAPLVEAVAREGWPALPIAIASLFVIVNGGLTQIIAAARLLMDLGRDARMAAPEFLGRINSKTKTPVIATGISLAIVLALALFVPLKGLASATSLVILIVFAGVNASLWRLKGQTQPEDAPNIWRIIPLLGLVFCLIAIAGQIYLWSAG